MLNTNSVVNGVNVTGSNNSEGPLPGRCPIGEQRGPHLSSNYYDKEVVEREKKVSLICYLRAIKESKTGYMKIIYGLCNELKSLEINE